MTDQITIDNLGPEAISRLRAEARRRGVAVGALIAELLQAALSAMPAPGEKQASEKHRLAAMAGTWSDEEAEAFLAAIADFEQIDEDLWK